MSNRSGSNYSLPRDANRVPAVGGVDDGDGVTVKPLEINNANGGLNVNQLNDQNVNILSPIGPNTSDGSVSITLATDQYLPAKSTDFYPIYNERDLGGAPLSTDPSGSLLTRGAITTDEGASRANFTGSAPFFTISNTSFENTGNLIYGSGFANAEIHYMDFIKYSGDPNNCWTPIAYINSDSQIELQNGYPGSTINNVSAHVSSVAYDYAGTGANVSVANGQLTLTTGTTNGAKSYVYKMATASSTLLFGSFTVSQRVNQQDIYFGFETALDGNARQFSRFRFTGTNNTQVITETGYNPNSVPSANEMETNTVTLPAGAITSGNNTYKIEQEMEYISFTINDILVAKHTKRIPRIMSMGNNKFYAVLRSANGTGMSSTNIVMDYMFVKMYDRIDSDIITLRDNTQTTQLTDGTNFANILKSDNTKIGNNAIMTAQTGYNTTFSTAAAGNFATTDMTNYGSVSVHLTSAGTNSVVTPQWSNDNTNWVAGSFTQVNGTTSGTSNTSSSGAQVLYTGKHGRYFRINVSGITAGTTAGSLHFSTAPTSYQTVGTLSTVNGGVAAGATDSGNPVKVGGVYNATRPTYTTGQRGDLQLGSTGSLGVTLFLNNATTAITGRADDSDAVAVAAGVQSNLAVSNRSNLYNGTSWDRQRSGAVANSSVATGIAGALGVAQYNSAAPTITDTYYNHLQIDSKANLKNTLGTLIAGEDLTVNVMKVEQRFTYQNITTATTTVVKNAAGFLHSITVNSTAAGTITVYDNTAGSGTIIATLKSSIVEATYTFDVIATTGITIVTGAASNITVSWR